ncbi:MAG TPA: hypothetical protein VHX18_02825 [Rhizomicrobium sp.]|jgi:hypothetical protein|nr:hypothetical protein [Rhizomicrobium sp.]
MLFGWIVRLGTFAINAGLVFLLAQQAPRLGLWDSQPDSSLFQQYRDNVLAGLSRVRADLESNGKLLLPAREAAGRPATGHTGDL